MQEQAKTYLSTRGTVHRPLAIAAIAATKTSRTIRGARKKSTLLLMVAH